MKSPITVAVLLCMCAASLPGCKKESDEILPSGTILSPTSGKMFFLPETVFVEASVSDDRKLSLVRIAITKGDGVPVSSVYQRTDFSGTSADVNAALVVENVHLASGNYFVQLTVGDGTNTREVFRPIQLIEVPLKLNATYFFKNQGAETLVDTLNGGTLYPVAGFSGNSSGGSAGSYFQELVLPGTFSNGIRFLAADGMFIWGQTPVAGGQNQISVKDLWVDISEGRYYAALADGSVKALGKKGQLLLNIDVGAGFVPEMVRVFGNSIFVFARHQAAGINPLFVFNKTSGVLLQSAQVDFSVADMFPNSSGGFLLFAGSGAQWTLKQMSASDLGVSDAGVGWSGGVLKNVLLLTSGKFAVLTDQGVYLTNASLSQINLVSGTQSVIRIRENRVSGRLFALSPASYFEIFPDGTTGNTIGVGQGMVDFDFLYNK